MVKGEKVILAADSPDRALGTLCKRSYYRFFCEMWETIENVDLKLNWHIEYVCNRLQEAYEIWAAELPQDDILINLPPGESKSTVVTQLFPAWLWVRNSSIRTISSSYAKDLAIAHATKTRDCLKSDKFQRLFPGLIDFKDDTDGKSHFKNTNYGERFVTSTDGRVTGMHGDFIIIDDPINPEEATSDADLKRAYRFVSRTLSMRKTDKERTVTIMVMQRLDEKDPAGMWLTSKNKGVNHICLPGEITSSRDCNVCPAELKDRYVKRLHVDGNGDLKEWLLLDPIRLSPAALIKAQTDLGSYGYANQIMQKSAPEDGGIWKASYFIPIEDNIFPKAEMLEQYGTCWDTAYTEDEMNDANAFCTAGRDDEFNVYIDKLGYFRAEFPELIHKMQLRPAPHYIEAKASGKSAKQAVSAGGVVAIEVEVGGKDKVSRTRTATPTAEAGKVFIRKSLLALLLHDHEQGLLSFPNGKHDDLNDVVVQTIRRLSKPRYKTNAA